MHHIELYVSDLAVTRQFYDELLVAHLGFAVFQEWPQGVSYRKNGVYLVFVQVREKANDVPFRRTRVGLNHLAFTIDSKAALDRLREAFCQAGVTLLYDEYYPYAGGAEHYALYLEDPDRIKLEIVWEKNSI